MNTPPRVSLSYRRAFIARGLLAAFLVGTAALRAQVPLTGVNPGYIQNFTTLPVPAANGDALTWTNNSTLGGWFRATAGTATGTPPGGDWSGDGAARTSNTPSHFNWGVAGAGAVTERAFGLRTTTGNEGSFGVAFKNDTTTGLRSVTVDYTGEQWRKSGATSATKLDLQYLVLATFDAGTFDINAATGWTDAPAALDFTSPITTAGGSALDGNAAANRSARSGIISFTTPVPAGSYVVLRWRYAPPSVSGHGLAVDDVSLSFKTLAKLQNTSFLVAEKADYSFDVTEIATGATAVFHPQFQVVYTTGSTSNGTANITGAAMHGGATQLNYDVIAWEGNTDFTAAPGSKVTHYATASSFDGTTLSWTFDPGSGYTLTANLTLAAGTGEPKVAYTLTPSTTKKFSIGYIGTSQKTSTEVSWIFQPMVWTGKRFPDKAYLTDESRCSLPLVLYGLGGAAIGLCVDPDYMPFRLATMANSTFGLTLRNSGGYAKPGIFAPIYGGAGSERSTPFTFAVRLIVRAGDTYNAFKTTATGLYSFGDYRKNPPLGSLNTALDNLVDYVRNTSGSNYSYWSAPFKANEYIQDKPGYGRQQSGLAATSLALIRDHRTFFNERGLPAVEFLASRARDTVELSGTDRNGVVHDGFDSAYPMGGPANRATVSKGIGDWAMLNVLSGGRTHAFTALSDAADDTATALLDQIDHTGATAYTRTQALDNAKDWLRALVAWYRMTGNNAYRLDAEKAADDYIAWRINQPPIDYYDVDASFWPELAPIWDALFELYEATGTTTYRDAGVAALREFTLFMNLCPRVSTGNITVDGGFLGAPALETIPAWRVAEVGLLSEAAGTSNSHRGIFMPYASGWLARAGSYSGDAFLTQLGKANIIGRFTNYPGYTVRTEYASRYEKPQYPLRWFSGYSNTMHTNHPLPMAAMTVDYLASDVFRRSNGQVKFPALLTDTGAGYMRYWVYGHASGSVYGEAGAWLWVPKSLATLTGTASEQINTIAAHAGNRLYLAFANQQNAVVNFTAALNSALVTFGASHTVRVWKDNVAQANTTLSSGSVALSAIAHGLTVIAIEGVTPQLDWQDDLINDTSPALGTSTFQSGAFFGTRTIKSMVFSFAPAVQSALVYTEADPTEVSSVTLHYRINGGSWQTMVKSTYPFEFSVPLTSTAATVETYLTDSASNTSATLTMNL